MVKTKPKPKQKAKPEKVLHGPPVQAGERLQVTIAPKLEDTQPGPEAIHKDRTVHDTTGVLEQFGNLKALDELTKKLNNDIKQMCFTAGARNVDSKHYVGYICGGGYSEVGDINLQKFREMCRQRGVKRADMDKVLSVDKGKIDFLSDKDIAACCDRPGPFNPWRLVVSPRKDIAAPTLVEAINNLAADTVNGKIPATVTAPQSENKPAPTPIPVPVTA